MESASKIFVPVFASMVLASCLAHQPETADCPEVPAGASPEKKAEGIDHHGQTVVDGLPVATGSERERLLSQLFTCDTERRQVALTLDLATSGLAERALKIAGADYFPHRALVDEEDVMVCRSLSEEHRAAGFSGEEVMKFLLACIASNARKGELNEDPYERNHEFVTDSVRARLYICRRFLEKDREMLGQVDGISQELTDAGY